MNRIQPSDNQVLYFAEEPYRNPDYGTVYYFPCDLTPQLNDFVKANAGRIAERINQNPRNWITCRIIPLDAESPLFNARRHDTLFQTDVMLYSALLPSEKDTSGQQPFLATRLGTPETGQFADLLAEYFDTLQEMLSELLDRGSYSVYHLKPFIDDGFRDSAIAESYDEEDEKDKPRVFKSTRIYRDWDDEDYAEWLIQNKLDDLDYVSPSSISDDDDFNQPADNSSDWHEPCFETVTDDNGETHHILLSRLTVTPYVYEVTLPDYDTFFHFTAQVKALYILFLNHPEGIRMKDIADYKDEYKRLYLCVTNRSDKDKLSRSVDKLFDAFSPNAMNVKKSQCNAVIQDTLRHSPNRIPFYIIEVRRGEHHRINLPRELVSIPIEL